MDAQTLYNQGVTAIKNKNISEGQRLLMQSLKQDKQNAAAWLWLARTFEDPQKREKAVDRALQLEPDNQLAIKFKSKLNNSVPKATKHREQVHTTTVPTGQAIITSHVFGLYKLVALVWSIIFFVIFLAPIWALLSGQLSSAGSVSEDLLVYGIFGIVILLLGLGLRWQIRKVIEAFRRKVTVYDAGIYFSDLDEHWSWGSLKNIEIIRIRIRFWYRLTPLVFRYNTHLLIEHSDGRKVKLHTVYTKFGELVHAINNTYGMIQ